MKQIHLPPSSAHEKVATALGYHHTANSSDHDQRRKAWTWTHYFLQGLRAIQVSGAVAASGIPSPTYHDSAGRKRLRFEMMLSLMRTEKGRQEQIDTAPVVTRRKGVGLDGLREESLSQALLDYVYSQWDETGVRSTLLYHLLAFGTVGVGVFPSSLGAEPWIPSLVVIPAWELRPVPANILGLQDLAGVEWFRWVPLKWLKSELKGRKARWPKGDDERLLRIEQVPIGARQETDSAPQPLGGTLDGTAGTVRSAGPGTVYDDTMPDQHDDASEDYVEIREFFLYGSPFTMSRYVLMVGDWVVIDHDYMSDEWQQRLAEPDDNVSGRIALPMMPVHISTYQEVGSFWGRSFIDRLLPINREYEYILGEHLQEMRNISRMRKVFYPISGGVNQRNLQLNARNAFVPVQPDYSAPNWKPFVPDIPSAGDGYGRTLNMLGEMLLNLAGHGPLLQGQMPGRADSLGAANVVGEYQALPNEETGRSLMRMWTGVYMTVLYLVRQYMRTQDAGTRQSMLVKISRLDESIIGLKFNPQTGTIDLSEHMLPDPLSLRMTIRHMHPQPKEAMLTLLSQLRNERLLTDTDWSILVVQEGLDVPMVSKSAWNNHETAWIENVLMFGDGETPGSITELPPFENHAIHLVRHLEFAGTHYMKHASDAVKQIVYQHLQYHREHLATLPDQFLMPGGVAGAGLVPPNPQMMAAAGRQMPEQLASQFSGSTQ